MQNNRRQKLRLGIFFAILFSLSSEGQPLFQNLNFENAITPLTIYDFKKVDTAQAVPGWTVYFLGAVPQSRMFFDTISLGEPAVSFHSSASVVGLPIQGHFSVILQAATAGFTTTAIGQVGQIPTDAMSLRFYGGMSLDVTFDGHPLTLIQTGSGSGYDQIAADISAYAGQSGELRFIASNLPVLNLIYLDNIRFSPLAIPEPSAFALFALGLFGLGWRARNTHVW